ncbi:murein L,D-transpeptidase [Palleronia sp.]|uniref:L,D-transpeptidase family protein n=1 Tax=Palleronia sp. TaxID=1940284 RepID=UPI0035C7A40F
MTVAILKLLALPAVVSVLALPVSAAAQVTPYMQAVAVAAAGDDALSTFYRDAEYEALWTDADSDDRARREALLTAVSKAELHGLPVDRYDAERLRTMMSNATDARARGNLEVELSRIFLRFASDISTGILKPNKVVPHIKRTPLENNRLDLLRGLASERPGTFMEGLAPESPEYARLMRERLRLVDVMQTDAWGAPVEAARLEEGASGPDVVSLRDRLAAMGYLGRSVTRTFDASVREAVERFQADHGLKIDGVVGGRTLEELNASPEERLGSILVAMERERWMNRDRGDRHIWVNLADFRTKIIVDGEVYFETKSIIGKAVPDRETPEFSDSMTHMVINPYWYVPRSITVKEYLPDMRRDPYAHSQLQVINSKGQVVDRGRGFSQFSASSFPYSMRQEPGPENALGLVKFMFPNKDAIYLHDTPAQSLFEENVRAFSHGCIRLDDPYKFGQALLTLDGVADPADTFNRHLNSGENTRVDLNQPLPVHLVYRTAMSKRSGGMEYRDDVYGRDVRILDALVSEGVQIPRSELRVASAAD